MCDFSPPKDGVKHDSGKDEWTLLPWPQLQPVVRVLMFGAKKYSVDNWKKVLGGPDRYINAALRHIVAHTNGERQDNESGEAHLAHAVCSLLFAMYHDTKPEDDLKGNK